MATPARFGGLDDGYSQPVVRVFLRALYKAIAAMDVHVPSGIYSEALFEHLRQALPAARESDPQPLSPHDEARLEQLIDVVQMEAARSFVDRLTGSTS